jgi:hypothetical protein
MPELPITRVVLYKHGVGYFERETSVDGDATLALTFKQREVSDVLKSLTILDLHGGHITAVSYDSTKPIEQLLAEIAISIPDQDSLFHLIPQLKGARVLMELSHQDGSLEGTILGVDVRESRTEAGLHRQAMVSVLTDEGEMQSVNLYENGLRILDPSLRKDLEFYLRTQLSAKKKEARTFTLFAQGEGQRTVRMSYVLEAPVWKATYRILLNEGASDAEPPMIQGWAVVDNTQDEDWNEVQLSLVAGLPVSFVHDLYTPRFIRRPVVDVRETTGVLPPILESGELLSDGDFDDEEFDERQVPRAAPPLSKRMKESVALSTAHFSAMPAELSTKSISSVQTQVRERQIGDLFEYEIERPVTIRRNQSALVPIVLKPFNGKSVLLYQKAARAENPMHCVEFENTTGLTLEGGPVTVLEGNSYVGEAMLETTKPKDQRLLAYAVELGVRVMDSIDSHSENVVRIVISQGMLTQHFSQLQTTTYTFISKVEKEQTLYLDHPRGGNEWKLLEPTKPHEITDTYWRFKFPLPGNKTTKFVVRQQLPLSQNYNLRDFNSKQLSLWIQQKFLDDKTAETLRQVLTLRKQLADIDGKLNQLQKERDQIHNEQKRIRENLNSLGDRPSEKELRERFVKTLHQQEDRLEAIDREGTTLRAERDTIVSQIEEILSKLHYEGKMA